jgi:hypothetical protein
MPYAYSFIDTQASLTGPSGNVNLGYGSGAAEEGITIAMVTDKGVMTIGADGSGMHSLRATKAGTVTVRLLKTSPTNAILEAMYNAESINPAVWGNDTITISQTGVGDLHTCNLCAFKKKPDMKYAQDGDILEWEFNAVKVESILGVY